jgi:tetratricopeptide (TPR) repeat protein
LLAGGGAAFMFLRQSGAPISAATDTPTPAPTVTPTPAATQEDPRIKQAREAESEERYKDAINLYGEYLAGHTSDTDPGVKEIKNRKSNLQEFLGLINLAQFEMNKKDYTEARRDYAKALEMRPDSKLARDGLAKADAAGRPAQ